VKTNDTAQIRGSIRYIVYGLSGIACILIFLFLYHSRHFYSISADESARTRIAYQWSRQPVLLLHNWLPLPQVIIGTALKFHPDLFRTPRLLSGMIGILTWLATVWLARELFRCPPVTMFSAVLAAALPDRALVSNIPLSEVYFFCFVVAGCAALARYLRQPSQRMIWFGAFCFALGNAVRYDSWVFSSVYIALITWCELRRSPHHVVRIVFCRLLGPAILLFAFPIYWMALWQIQRGNFMLFSKSVADEYFFLYGHDWRKTVFYSPLIQFLVGNLFCLNIIGLASLAGEARTNPHIRRWLLAPVITLACMSLAALGGSLPSHGFWRLGALWSLLLVPFTAHFVWQVSARLVVAAHQPPQRRIALAASLMAGLLAIFVFQLVARSQTSFFSVDQRETGEYFKQQFAVTPSPQRVIIDSSSWGYLNIAIASNRPELFVPSAGIDTGHQEREFFDAPPAQVQALLAAQKYSNIVVFKPTLKQKLQTFSCLKPVATIGLWSVYTVDIKAPQPAAPQPAPAVASVANANTLPLRLPPTGSYLNATPLKLTLSDQVSSGMQQMWDGAAHNVLYITNTRWGQQMIFDLHLCEDLIVDTPAWPAQHFVNNRRLDADRWQWQERPDGWHFTLDQQDVLNVHLEGRVWASGDQQLKIEGSLFNRMPQAWTNGTGLICLRTRNAAPFVDTTYQHVFLIPQAAPTQSLSVRQLLGTDFDPKLPGSQFFNFWVAKPGMPHFLPAIRKTDVTGKRQVQLETAPAISLGGNRQPTMNCIHSNLAVNIAPGGYLHFTSIINFSDLQ
jgi:hypothetical protein